MKVWSVCVAVVIVGMLMLDISDCTEKKGDVEVTVFAERKYALCGIKNTLALLFEIDGRENFISEAVKVRPPVHLALVLDRSGSMYGEKLQYAKQAMSQIIRSSIKENDLVQIIIYDSSVDVLIEQGTLADQKHMLALIDEIQDRGSTDIGQALQTGADLLAKVKDQEIHRVNRMFLFSDGLPNAGLSGDGILGLAEVIRSSGIGITTFGIGADFDEELMTGIAGDAGDYFYISTADSIPRIVDHAMTGLDNLVATNAVLRLQGQNGAIVEKVIGWPDVDLLEGVGIGDIRATEKRKLVAEMSFALGDDECNEELIPILEWTLEYTTNSGNTASLSGAVEVKQTQDRELAQWKDQKVTTFVQLQHIADRDREIMEHLDQGNVRAALELGGELSSGLDSLPQTEEVKRTKRRFAATAKAVRTKSIKEARKQSQMSHRLGTRYTSYHADL